MNVMVMCIATYEATGSQVQMALERGLPAMLGNFITKQLPYPSLSFDMVHCAQCEISWNDKGNSIINLDVTFFYFMGISLQPRYIWLS